MKKVSLVLVLSSLACLSFAQNIDKILNAKEVERIERTLSSDEMQGRATFTPGNDKAAAFIADEFKKAGLKTWNNSGTYIQQIPALVGSKPVSLSAKLDGIAVDAKNIVVLSGKQNLQVDENSGYEKATIAKGANFNVELRKYMSAGKKYFVLVDTSFASNIGRLQAGNRPTQPSETAVILVLTTSDPATYSVTASFPALTLQNVMGVIPGKSRPNEYVIFSGHYDHLGIMPTRPGSPVTDSIFNGANDDAAGTTAVIMLAKYFSQLKNNERTLIFCAFTAEEIGGFGARYFSRQFKPEEVIAMFNIEMIGTESKWGTNSAYITGYEKTDMGKILQGNLEGTGFTFYPDPYTKENLFYRSDNATLARLGVPAHTISTSKMDSEPNYHKVSDEIGTLDMENMARIIKAIALSSKGIISGKETPSRVDTSSLTR